MIQPRRCRRLLRTTDRAFTLIEVLVVISLIALLVSILLPALNKARNQGMTVKCLANLRELLMATQYYWDANDDQKLVPWYQYPVHAGYNPNPIAPWVFGGSKATRPGQYPNADSSLYPAEIRPLNKYIDPYARGTQLIRSFVCPGDRSNYAPIIGTNQENIEEEVIASWEANGTSYSLNTSFMEGYGGGTGNFSIDDIQPFTRRIAPFLTGGHASRFIMWGEQGFYTSCYRATPQLPNQASALKWGWHRKFSNWSAGFADGHAMHGFYDTRLVYGLGGTIWQPDFRLPSGS
ncbi:hypothetical protein RAS2_29750 [Phycisphaerae bacterium RAS2]|nr:hypothetical protein RAS2_29750 [Phycisphaerae bacterium RAS2]